MKFIWLLAVAAALSAQPTGRIEGKVVNPEGRPVPLAIVTLQGLSPIGNPTGPDSYIVATDLSGRFQADEVLPGRYEAAASRDGFDRYIRGIPLGKVSRRITLAPGQSIRDIVLLLVPLGVIAGRLVDADGDPIPAAYVQALRIGYSDGQRVLTPYANGTADDRGQYRLFDMAPGRYYVRATAPGNRPRMTAAPGINVPGEPSPTYFPSATDSAQAAPLDLPAGAELTDVHIRMVQQGTYRIRVNVVAPGPGDVTILTVALSGGRERVRVTAVPGRPYEHTPSPPGSYLVEAEDQSRNLVAREIVTLSNSDVDLTLHLARGLSLPGVVHIQGGGDLEAAAVRVRFDSEDRTHTTTAVVNPDGTFEITHLRAIRYRVRAEIKSGGYLEGVRTGGQYLPDTTIEPTRVPIPLDLTVKTDGGTLEGHARTSEGEPVERGSIALIPTGNMRARTDLALSTVTDYQGRFTLRDIAPGAYRLFAFEDAEDGAALDPEFRERFEKQAIDVEVAANGRHTIEVKAISVLLK